MLAQQTVPSHCSDHNAALKAVRSQEEYSGNHTKELCLGVNLDSDYTVENLPLVLKPPNGGEDYFFHPTESFHWCVLWMMGNLMNQDIDAVVRGPSGRGRGIVKAVASSRDNAKARKGHYDHKRHVAEVKGNATWRYKDKPEVNKPEHDLEVWDFVLTRSDGSSFWMHPNWGESWAGYGEVKAENELVQAPPSGRGSSGKGRQLFKEFKLARDDGRLHFDRNKNVIRGKTRVKKMTRRPQGKSGDYATLDDI